MKLAVVMLALALLAGILAAGSPVLAAPDIVVISTRHQNKYPVEVVFSLEAQSSSAINKVVFNYTFVGSKSNSYSKIDFEPANQVKIEHKWDTRQKHVTPGGEMDYYWEIEDAGGGKHKTSPVHFVFDDTRFQWKTITEGKVTLMWYKGDDGFGKQMMQSATRAVRQLADDAGIEVKAPIKIMLYGTQKDMMEVLEQGAHEWTGGRSFSDEGIVVIASGDDRQGIAFGLRAVPHELSHVITYRATENPYSSLPTWLNEGLSMYAEGDLESSYSSALNRAVSQNKLISLRSLNSGFAASGDQAHLSYAQSYSVVKYIIDKYGKEGMSKLMDAFSKGTTPERALQQALGINQATLESDWRASLGATPPATSATGIPAATAVPSGKGVSSSFNCTAPAIGLTMVGGAVAWFSRRRRYI